MPKVTKYPRLRTKVYKGKGGQAYVYYVYDMRGDGEPDIRLGKDYAEAVKRWDEIHNHKPRVIGRLQEAFDRYKLEVLPAMENPETRRSYGQYLKRLEGVLGGMTWDEVDLPLMVEYLKRRKSRAKKAAKGAVAGTQGNREMSLLSVVWGRAKRWGMTKLPWPAAGVKDWKNPEREREFAVTDELFAATYAEGDQVLRDCMDIASATGLRLTDARTVRMPADGKLRHKASKSKKWAEFDVAESPVLLALVERREAMKAYSVMLLSTPTGRQVTYRMLRDRWDEARDKAAKKAEKTGNAEFAATIRAMYLRDMRSRAADLAEGLDEASKLLQHSSKAVTLRHYRTKAEKLKAVR